MLQQKKKKYFNIQPHFIKIKLDQAGKIQKIQIYLLYYRTFNEGIFIKEENAKYYN